MSDSNHKSIGLRVRARKTHSKFVHAHVVAKVVTTIFKCISMPICEYIQSILFTIISIQIFSVRPYD